MMRYLLLSTYAICFLTLSLFGQNPNFRMHLVLNEKFNPTERKTIRTTSDGGYAIFGSTAGSTAVFFIKTDSLGNVQFQKTYTPTTETALFKDVIIEPNGTYTLLSTHVKVTGDDFWFLRLSATGEILVSKFYTASSLNSSTDEATTLKKTPDNQYLLFGKSNPFTMIVFRVDSLGVRQWSKGYNFHAMDIGSVELLQNYLYITGYADKLVVCKMDLNGNIIWVKREYDILNRNYGSGARIVKTSDNKLVIGNHTDALIKIDTSGNVLWAKSYSASFSYQLGSLIATSDGGFISCSSHNGQVVGVVLEGIASKFNAAGDLVWVKRIGTAKDDEFYEVTPNANGRGWTLFGRTRDFGIYVGVLLVKIDALGNLFNATCENELEIELTSPVLRTLTMQLATSTTGLTGVTVSPTPQVQITDIQPVANFSPCGDVQLSNFVLPNSSQTCESVVPVKVRVTNQSAYPIGFLAIATYVNNNYVGQTQFENLNLLPNRDSIFSLPNVTLNNGASATITVDVFNVNGFSDRNPNNNRLSTTIRYQVDFPTIQSNPPLSYLCRADSVAVSVQTPIAGTQYQWLRNGTPILGATSTSFWVKDDASYRIRATSVANCVTESNGYQLSLLTPPTQPVITRSGSVLTATGSNGTSFQWYLNGVRLNNAVQMQYTAVNNGIYTVESVIENCRTLSQPYNYIMSGAIEIGTMTWHVAPNPCTQQLQLLLDTPSQGQLTLYDAAQQIVWQQQVDATMTSIFIPMHNKANGVYWVRLETEGKGRSQQKVVKLE
jgi:hypothetical protein